MDFARAPDILIVDDDRFLLGVLAKALNRLGFDRVRFESDSRLALERLRGGEVPDVCLLDLNMPEMDGVEFLRGLADIRFQGGIILLSGENENIRQTVKNLARSHRLNVLGHLQKPPEAAQLESLIRGWEPARRELRASPKRSELPEPTEAELRAALANGELINYYQPKVEAATGRLKGVETLVRWRHPEHGIVPPDRFIPLIESYGLIDALTQVVIVGALRQARAWQDQGMALEIAINVSMDNLKCLDFPDQVIALAQERGVSPEQITLEVTESQLARDITLPMDILTRLRLKRVSLSIDDFGTGYSSLAQLMDLPFNELKIDRSFVQAADNDERARLILESSVELARKLQMRIVAEGVETSAQWDFVTRLGCDLIQGYRIARPMPAEDFALWAEDWTARYP